MQGDEQKEDEEFAIVFAAMGVNMETAHFFKQVHYPCMFAQRVTVHTARLLFDVALCSLLKAVPPAAGGVSRSYLFVFTKGWSEDAC